MIVNTDQIRIGIKKYIENELAYKANGVTKFMIYFVMPSIDKKLTDYITKAKENDMLVEFFSQDGCVHLDKVYDRAIFAIDKAGNKVLIDKYGISLDRSDVEKIYQYVRES